MESFFKEAAMKFPTLTHGPFRRRLLAACTAYFTAVCACLAAAAAVVMGTVPLMVGGL